MSKLRSVVFGGVDFSCAVANLAVLILRAFAGLTLALAHGMGKIPPADRFIEGVGKLGFPMPQHFAWAAGLSEFVGGY